MSTHPTPLRGLLHAGCDRMCRKGRASVSRRQRGDWNSHTEQISLPCAAIPSSTSCISSSGWGGPWRTGRLTRCSLWGQIGRPTTMALSRRPRHNHLHCGETCVPILLCLCSPPLFPDTRQCPHPVAESVQHATKLNHDALQVSARRCEVCALPLYAPV
ncbi:hypothetical protein L226DRAFT_617903 [Lentinus tigrinus ALCF2SS1-7]|uniref:uncharacterized protein n=1 Tax=Lentinus tigrinus ALCF2SS1-7 TaxID=1328758 RepID=UPI0011663FB7|nr:hypothetical protein L226DRAFT_617903 [Lentinus tigrinus ALCF2SS1-7]